MTDFERYLTGLALGTPVTRRERIAREQEIRSSLLAGQWEREEVAKAETEAAHLKRVEILRSMGMAA